VADILVVSAAPDLVRQLSPDDDDGGVRAVDAFADALAELPGADVDAVVLAPAVAAPVEAVQALHGVDAELAVVVVTAPGGEADMAAALRFAPFVGNDVVIRAVDDDRLREDVAAACRRTSQRRSYRRAVAVAEAGLAAAEPIPLRGSGAVGDLLEHAPVGAVTADPDGRILGWNRRAEALLDLDSVRPGENLLDRFPPIERRRLRRVLAAAADGTATTSERLFRRAAAGDGSRFLEVGAAPVPLGDGRRGLLVLLADVTDRVTAERERARAQMVLAAQYEIVRALAESERLVDATRRILRVVCESLDWQLGAFWRVDAYAGVLRFVDAWATEPDVGRRFRAASPDFLLRRGEGLLGAAWERGGVVWIEDLARREAAAAVRRAELLRSLGLTSVFALPVGVRGEVIGVFEFGSITPRPSDDELVAALEAAGHQIAEFVARAEAQQELRLLQEHRTQLVAAMLAAQEEERRRIAAELHDDTIQVLAAALLQLDMLRDALDDQPAARRQVETLRETLDAAGDRARELTFGLRPQVLEARGIAPAVRQLVETAVRDTGAGAHVEVPDRRYPWNIEQLVYRTVSEALANVRRHAGATRVEVVIEDDGAALVGHVDDDGTGFDPARLHAGSDRPRLHLGVEGMAERVRLAGGELVIDSAPGRGTAVRFTIPYAGDALPDAAGPPRLLHRDADEWLALLDTLLEQAPIGLAFWDASFRYIRINDRLAEVNGMPVEEHIGQTVAEVLPDIWEKVAPALRHVLERNEPIVDLEVTGETPAEPGRERQWLSSYYPVRGRSGEVLGIGGVVVEVTEQRAVERERARLLDAERHARSDAEAARDRLALFARASRAFAESLEVEPTLRRIAVLTVSSIADWCVIDLLDGGRLCPLANAHADPARSALVGEVHDAFLRAEREAALARRRPLLLTGLAPDRLVHEDADERAREVVRSLEPASAMVVPLIPRGRPVGVVTLVRAADRRPFGDDDLALAVELAGRAALALENARLYEERNETAHALQRSLLPPALPWLPGADVGASYQPMGVRADVGGDFYDVFGVREGEWALAVGDVAGKGPQAAAMTGLVRHTLRAIAAYRDGDGALRAVNDALIAEHADRFCTVAFARVWPREGVIALEVCLAGHPFPYVVRADGTLERGGLPGMLLGVFPEPALRCAPVELAPGDAIVFYTDGVTEARRDGELFGEKRLGELLAAHAGRPAPAIADAIERAVREFAPHPTDDRATLVLRAT
jgi:PAS domain S-box-containing protein